MTKILLVEDDKNLREIYGTRLYAEGYDIVSAGDGEAALAMAIKERPDLIISDVMMPKISGFDMLDILRSTTETKNIPVIMMTALSSEDQQARGEALGANRYLVKSQVGIEDVVRTVHEVLQDVPGMQQAAPTQQNAPAPRQETSTTAVPQRQAPAEQQAQYQAAAQQQQPQTFSQPASQQQQQPQTNPTPPPPPAPHAPVAGSSASDTSNDGSLPRPIAPFSTPRPAGLGDRVIHPIERGDSAQTPDDVASKMAAALSGTSAQPQPQAQAQAPQQQPQPQQPQQTPQQPQILEPQPASLQPQATSDNSPLPYDLPPVIQQPETTPQPQQQAPEQLARNQQPQQQPPQPPTAG